MPQYYKGDADELKLYNSGRPILEEISLAQDDFFDDCYSCFKLGELIFDNELSPLANAITREIFRETFFELYQSFVNAGSFYSYLDVFSQIFGVTVDIQFAVPNPGHLQIDIEAGTVELAGFLARYIQDNEYLYDQVVDHEGDRIVFQSIKGFETQYELEQMLKEMVPAGIFCEISLTIGGA